VARRRLTSPGTATGDRLVGLPPEHREVGEGTVEQRRLDQTAAAVDIPSVKRAEDADGRQVAGADRGERQALEDRALPMTSLVGHRPDQGMDQGLTFRHRGIPALGAEP
jgi:hypothetical protein